MGLPPARLSYQCDATDCRADVKGRVRPDPDRGAGADNKVADFGYAF